MRLKPAPLPALPPKSDAARAAAVALRLGSWVTLIAALYIAGMVAVFGFGFFFAGFVIVFMFAAVAAIFFQHQTDIVQEYTRAALDPDSPVVILLIAAAAIGVAGAATFALMTRLLYRSWVGRRPGTIARSWLFVLVSVALMVTVVAGMLIERRETHLPPQLAFLGYVGLGLTVVAVPAGLTGVGLGVQLFRPRVRASLRSDDGPAEPAPAAMGPRPAASPSVRPAAPATAPRRRLACPRCRNVIVAAPGSRPVCPKCGYA